MSLLIEADREEGFDEWCSLFAGFLPGEDIRRWNDPAADPNAVEYVFCFDPEPGRLAALPNLRLICAASVGVDRIVRDASWDRRIPLVRMGCTETTAQMADYVGWACLSLHRSLPRILRAMSSRQWDKVVPPGPVATRRAGVMGMGSMGTAAAAMLRDIGFRTAGWSRTRKSVPGVESYAGPEELQTFLQRTDLLVCLMPGTPETAGIVDAACLAALAPGAGVVNAARGSHVVVPDLLAALEAGQLSGAILDVFDREPLPPDDPLWTHPGVVVTSHLASTASRRSRAHYASDVILAFQRGERLPNRYDPDAGY